MEQHMKYDLSEETIEQSANEVNEDVDEETYVVNE